MAEGAHVTVDYSSLRAWNGETRVAYRAWCMEWMRKAEVPADARWGAREGDDWNTYWQYANGEEWHLLIVEESADFGVAESRHLTARIMAFIAAHPRLVTVTLALPLPFAMRVGQDSGAESQEWHALVLRCRQLAHLQGREVIITYWKVTDWQVQWHRKKQEGTLAFWFHAVPLSTEWLRAQSRQAFSRWSNHSVDVTKNYEAAPAWLNAWFRDAVFYQKLSQLRRKLYRMADHLSAVPFPDAQAIQQAVHVLLEALWWQPTYPRQAGDHQRTVTALTWLEDRVRTALHAHEREGASERKVRQKWLLYAMRVLQEVHQWHDTWEWRVFKMPYVTTSETIAEEAQAFTAMLRRGMNGKNPFLMMREADTETGAIASWLEHAIGVEVPLSVLWETLQLLGDKRNQPVLVVIISTVPRSSSEWESWVGTLLTQWMNYPRLSCWIHRGDRVTHDMKKNG